MANKAPDYLKEYLKDVSNPYERSLIGNYFSKQKEQESYPTGEELFPEEQPEQVTEGTSEAAPQEGANWSSILKDHTSYFKFPAVKGLLAKLGPKAVARASGYALGGPVGWGMAATDAVDYFGYPVYDHIPGGDYLSWRDTTEQEGEE